MATGFVTGFDDPGAMVDERADGIADDLGAGEQFDQFIDGAASFGDLVVGGLDAGYVIHHLLDPGPVPASGNEREVVFAQEFRNQPPRKTIGTV
jgi:hypothetical protein